MIMAPASVPLPVRTIAPAPVVSAGALRLDLSGRALRWAGEARSDYCVICVGAHGKPAFSSCATPQNPEVREIVFNGGASVIDCMASNISSGGVAIEVPSTAGIPSTFTLLIGNKAEQRACHIAW